MIAAPALICLASIVNSGDDPVDLFREDVLGTSLHLRIEAPDTTEARVEAVEAAVLDEIERWRRAVDRYDERSELRSLKAGISSSVSDELRAALSACREWRIETGGAFDPAVGHLEKLWRKAEAGGTPPGDAAIAKAVHEVRTERPRFDDVGFRATPIELSLDGLAKGMILDAAVQRALAKGASSAMLDIGGDIAALGTGVNVQVADPRAASDNAGPLTVVRLVNAAIATSGQYKRGFTFDGVSLGHVIDPRTGRPVQHVLQASVVAPTAAIADALATSLMVLPVDRGLDLVRDRESVECLIVKADGVVLRSDGWANLESGGTTEKGANVTGASWGSSKAVKISFQLDRPKRIKGKRGGSYRRPYVAVWVEDPSGSPVRTLALWIERERWLKDLRRWYRLHRTDESLIDAVTMPTRKPGEYVLSWDGRDDSGKVLPLGSYEIKVEVAREHGTYQLVTLPIDLSEEYCLVRGNPNVELKSVSATFGSESDSRAGEGHGSDDREAERGETER